MSKPIVAVAFYSTYGHIATLAEAVIKGAESTGVIVKPYQIAETLPAEVLEKMYAGSSLKPKYPILTPDDLKEVDGLILGAPTRYGRVPAQVSAFFDQTGGLWATGALVGKAASFFTSAAGQHSGHETTALTTIPYFAHLVFVPLGYSHPQIGSNAEVQGTAPWGASTIAGPDGARQPTEGELAVAEHQGKFFSNYVAQVHRGKHLLTQDAAAAKSATATATATNGETAAGATAATALGKPAEGDKGYTVPAEGTKTTESTAADTAATTTPATAASTVPAAVANASTTTPSQPTKAQPAEKAAAATATKEKKGGLFSCCSGSGIDK